jgi:hypothetical protein
VDVQQHRPPFWRRGSLWNESSNLAVLQTDILDSPYRPDRRATGDGGCLPDIWMPRDRVRWYAVCYMSIVQCDVFRVEAGKNVGVDRGGKVCHGVGGRSGLYGVIEQDVP